MKKICVAISCYNQEKYIEECASHLLAQRIENAEVEILVCDDASTDRTRDVINKTVKKMGLGGGWTIVNCANTRNLGMAENTKRIIRMLMDSKADYGCILEGDDYWLSPFWLAEHVKAIEEDTKVSMSNNHLLFYFQEENRFEVRQYPEKVGKSKYIPAAMQAEDNYTGNFSSNLYRLSALRNIPADFLEQPYVDDWFVNLLMAEQGKIASIKRPLSVYRVHQESVWNGRKKKKKLGVGEHTISQRIRFVDQHYPKKYLAELANFSERWAQIPMKGKIYFDAGKGFEEKNSVPIYMIFDGINHFEAELDFEDLDLSEPPKRVKRMRYDPEEGYECEITNLEMWLNDEKVEAEALNGEVGKNGEIRFETKDPILMLKVSKQKMKEIKKIRVAGEIKIS